MPRVICLPPTRSPAVRIPPVPEACAWLHAMPSGSPTPIPTCGWMGISASSMQGLMSAQARATFQATDLVVFTLTAGQNIVTPVSCATFLGSLGHMSASRLPL